MRKLLLSLLLAASSAFGAFTYIASASADTSTAGINTTGANLLVVAVTLDSGYSGLSLYDSVGGNANTGCFIPAKSVSIAGSAGTYLYYCVNPTYVGAGHTFSISVSNGYPSIYVAAYSGAASSPLDSVTNSASNNANPSIQPGSITPSCSNELVVSSLFNENGTATVSGSTLRNANATHTGDWGGALADAIQTTATAINPTWTVTSGHNATVIVAFKSTASACGGAYTAEHTVVGGV